MKLALRLGFGILLLIALAAAAGYAWLRQSLPQLKGTLVLPGLTQPVEILRDRHGVPHIYAGSIEDANFALGFAHAQDRLWQMEMNRRIAWGYTNTGPDVQDLYIERVDGAGRVLSPQGWQELATRNEVVKVKGRADVTLTVRESRHGPLISDVSKPAAQGLPHGFALALAWTALREDELSIPMSMKRSDAMADSLGTLRLQPR